MQWEDCIEFLTLEQAGLEGAIDRDTVPGACAAYYKDEN
jgi:hypothetical protein